MIVLIRIKSQNLDFQTAIQSQIDFKMANELDNPIFDF